MAAIPTGTWIEGRVRLRKLSKTLAFLDAEAPSGETLLLAVTATFRIFQSIDAAKVRTTSMRQPSWRAVKHLTKPNPTSQGKSGNRMKFIGPRPFADPNVAGRKLRGAGQALEPVQDGSIEKIKDPSCISLRARLLNAIAVADGYHGRGIGKRLISWAEIYTLQSDLTRLSLHRPITRLQFSYTNPTDLSK
jgi:hypothetical protein